MWETVGIFHDDPYGKSGDAQLNINQMVYVLIINNQWNTFKLSNNQQEHILSSPAMVYNLVINY